MVVEFVCGCGGDMGLLVSPMDANDVGWFVNFSSVVILSRVSFSVEAVKLGVSR